MLGEKIQNLRKKNNLSQEVLAEKLGVARQTISKWELGETSPAISDAQKLSKIFNVSLDELVGNDTKEILVEKVSNTEKLAGIIITILKVFGILFSAFLILIIIAIICFSYFKTNRTSFNNAMEITCTLDNNKYTYGMKYNDNYQISEAGGDAFFDYHELTDSTDANVIKTKIDDYFKSKGGECIFEDFLK